MSEMREEKNGSTVSGKHMGDMQMNSTATGSGSATAGLGKSGGLRTASMKNKNLVGSKHKTNESNYNEDRSNSRDPYHQNKFQKNLKKDKSKVDKDETQS